MIDDNQFWERQKAAPFFCHQFLATESHQAFWNLTCNYYKVSAIMQKITAILLK
jgi:hypothetical protein